MSHRDEADAASWFAVIPSNELNDDTVGRVIVRLRSVSKRWDGRPVVEQASYSLLGRRTYLVLGRSGVGKSTLLNMIAGYVEPDSGSVEVDGTIAYLLQDEMLFSTLTVRENLALLTAPLELTPEVLDQRLAAAVSRMRLNHLLNDKVQTLSGGERRRVELACINCRRPDVLLMDEPTASLDPASRAEAVQLIDDCFAQTCRVVVTHDEGLVRDFRNATLLALVNGQIIER